MAIAQERISNYDQIKRKPGYDALSLSELPTVPQVSDLDAWNDHGRIRLGHAGIGRMKIGDDFLIGKGSYSWALKNADCPWVVRDGPRLAYLGNRAFMFGGWNSLYSNPAYADPTWGGSITTNEVWATDDAAQTGTLGEVGNVAECQFEYGSSFISYEARVATGASPCYVPKLYDQLGSNHAIQVTGTLQPQIIPRQIGEWPILVGDGVDDKLGCAGLLTSFANKDLTLITAGPKAYCGNENVPRLYHGPLFAYGSYSITLSADPNQVTSMVASNLDQRRYVNSVQTHAATESRVAAWTYPDVYFGKLTGGGVWGNPPLASILLPVALSPTQRASVESALMTEYSITP